MRKGKLDEWPLTEFAAVSVGWLGAEDIVLDLTQYEDQAALADLTVVATQTGEVIEVHGGGEGKPVPQEVYRRMLTAGLEAAPRMVKEIHALFKQA
ncbi:MAG: hypothetical protein M1157_04610 [Deinococcus sp.]|nr:hypothetical protein [Deinococcus sp.]